MSIVRMRKNMQSWFRPVMLLVAVALAISIVLMMAGSGSDRGEEGRAAGVLAKVSGQKLDRAAFEQSFESRMDEMEEDRLLSAFEAAQLRGQMFDDLVDRVLRIQAAEREGIKVSRREVKAKINEIVEGQLEQIKEQLLAGRKGEKTDEAFEAELKRNDMSVGKLKADIRKSIDEGQLREQLLYEKLVDKLKKSVKATDEAVRESYTEVRFRQITVGIQKRSEAQAKQRAEELVGKLKGGADFAALAREHSEDPYKTSGGDRGYFMRRAYMESELADAAFKLKPGEISGPVKTSQGFVILKVEERQSTLPADFSDPKKKKEYQDTYLFQEQRRVQSEYFDNLRENAKIEVYDAELKGYLLIKQIGMTFGVSGDADRKAMVLKAIEQYKRALGEAGGAVEPTARAYAVIAYLYDSIRRPGFCSPTKEEQVEYRAEAKKALQNALEYSESNDLRMMIADILIEEGQYDKAVEHLQIVSENAFDDPAAHNQILGMCEQMRGSQKAAAMIASERKWIEDYKQTHGGGEAGDRLTIPIQ